MKLNSVEELIEDIRLGRMVILMDDEDRENEGDLVLAAGKVRPEDINFMAVHARGLICLTLTERRCRQLDLPLMVTSNNSSHGTNFTVSIEAAEGVTTGISAADRARTVQVAVAAEATPTAIVQPGHIFPLKAQPGGVLSRAGHTEAGCDLAQLAGHEPAAVIVEIMNDDGTMARRPDLELFAQKHNLKIGTIADLIHYRLVNDRTVECIGERVIQTAYGEFLLKTYVDTHRGGKHFALVKGDISPEQPILVRVHMPSIARDLLAIERPGPHKSWSLQKAMQQIATEGCGALVLLDNAETNEQVEASIDAMLSYQTMRKSASEVIYLQVGTGSQILRDLGLQKLRLMSAPFRFSAISGFDLEVVEYVDCP
ncbi:MAG: bifunctional 3,4-dihydroxy-2-butanone-4-phosphate synthase/GTP cyclohydrolase II [Porticoccaceae bacterium]